MAKSSNPWLRSCVPGSRSEGKGPFLGLVIAFAILAAVEFFLHTDLFLYRYRSVFAAGRAMDKVRFVEANPPSLLIVGNSRVDNGFRPASLVAELPRLSEGRSFNLGIPGADARILHGVLTRLSRNGVLGPGRVEWVVIGLDEALIQGEDSLGYAVFFSDRDELLSQGEYRDWLRSWIRLWGYADNLKELREPSKLQRFIEATFHPVAPMGGEAAVHLGYRAGIGQLQDSAAAFAQEVGSRAPPDARRVHNFERCLDLLARHGVKVAVVFPPLLNRTVLYLDAADPAAHPFREFSRQLQARGVPIIELTTGQVRSADEFVNAGHLNDKGARRFSVALANALGELWPELKEHQAQ